jgi:threonylcarbamoyladenosine tRNA methylthiotransferase MtaB
MEKTVAFATLGCKVNQYDTQSIRKQFTDAGWETVPFTEAADAYVINTCTVTGEAARKSRQMIRRARRVNPDAAIAVVGCLSQQQGEALLELPGVTLIVGTDDRRDLPQRLDAGNAVTGIGPVRAFEEMPIDAGWERARAVVKIQDGCDRYCAYCIIPYVRGRIRSRDPEHVIEEVKRLTAAGYKEIILTGIHVSSYGKERGDITLPALVERVHAIEGVQRLRVGSLEPDHMRVEWIEVFSALPKICRHYHLSLQSGSDAVLERMHRRYDTTRFTEVVESLRMHIPDVAITTDVIVGFPGETEAAFAESLAYVEKIGFSRVHVFPYSRREGTKAAGMPGQIPKAVKADRVRRMIEIARRGQSRYMEAQIGKTLEVLFEEEKDGLWEGYTDTYVRVAMESGEDLQGEIRSVRLDAVEGELIAGSLSS